MNTATLAKVEIDETAILRFLGLNPKDPAAQALVLTCRRYELDPILRHMVLIDGRPYVTRDGLLHVAHRSEQLDGIEVLEQSETETHHVAKVAVYRKDMKKPFAYVGRFPKQRWNKKRNAYEEHPYGPEMAVKCAEVMALRRAFDVSLAAREEMWDREDVQQEDLAGSTRADNSETEPSAADLPSHSSAAVAPPSNQEFGALESSTPRSPAPEAASAPENSGEEGGEGEVASLPSGNHQARLDALLQKGVAKGRVTVEARKVAKWHGAPLVEEPEEMLEKLSPNVIEEILWRLEHPGE